FLSNGVGGGDVILNDPPKAAKPGQWLMLTGTTTSGGYNYFSWYRVVAAGTVDKAPPGVALASGANTNKVQSVTLAGPDWNIIPASGSPLTSYPYVSLFDGVIAVYEKDLRLEL